MENVVIAAYGRTPFSRSRPKEPEKDPFGQLTGEELLAAIMPAVLERAGISNADADKFLIGCALGVGEQWTFGGRTSALLAGLSPQVPSHFIDMQCGSGMAGDSYRFCRDSQWAGRYRYCRRHGADDPGSRGATPV